MSPVTPELSFLSTELSVPGTREISVAPSPPLLVVLEASSALFGPQAANKSILLMQADVSMSLSFFIIVVCHKARKKPFQQEGGK